MKVAIFDFDGTLYEEETFPVMMDYLKGHPIYSARYRKFLMKILPSYVGAKLKIYPSRKMQRKAMQYYIQALQGLTKDEVYEYFKEIAEHFSQGFNKRMISSFHDHLQKGHYIMLVSGAYSPLLKQATRRLPFHEIIGTELSFVNNFLDDQAPILHIQGEKKTEAIINALGTRKIDWENSYAYADSYSDLPVFHLVGNPIAVAPDDKLKRHAQLHNWEIVP